ncbi:hypothetical protein ES703_79946 [subsurface metagenome]
MKLEGETCLSFFVCISSLAKMLAGDMDDNS